MDTALSVCLGWLEVKDAASQVTRVSGTGTGPQC